LIEPAHERALPPTGPAFADAVTFAFGDEAAQLYGIARLGISPGADGGARSGSALAVLFSGREPAAVVARGGIPVPDGAGWEAIALGGLRASVDEPLQRWTVAFEGDSHAFALVFEALGPPAELAAGDPVAAAGGMAGYEQVCEVRGVVRDDSGGERGVHCFGARGHAWGEPDWSAIESARTIAAWPQGGLGLALSAVRPAGAESHAAEPTWAALLGPDGALVVDDPRLSTTYDGDGHQRRAGLELWAGDAEHRGSGEILCGSTLELGQLQLDCAFFRWRLDGRSGVGRYDILRRV
jgi:hypothetical protein